MLESEIDRIYLSKKKIPMIYCSQDTQEQINNWNAAAATTASGYFEEIDPVYSVSPAAELDAGNVSVLKALKDLVKNSSDWAAFKSAVDAL